MQTDPLSNVLRVIRLSGGMFLRVRMSPPFGVVAESAEQLRRALAPEAEQLLPFHLVTDGPVWIHPEGEEPVRLESGDILVLPHGSNHGLSDLRERPLEVVPDMLSNAQGNPPTVTRPGSDPATERGVLCGFFACRAHLYSPLLESLPTVVVIRHDPHRSPWLEATLRRTFEETVERRPGSAALIEQLTSLLFMEVVQRHLECHSGGWLGALSDPLLGKVLQFIHGEPGAPWTVETLARRAGVSRSVLAERFAQSMGLSPIKYLTAWRLELAAARLMDSDDALAEIAAEVGYDSEASFNRAFKRHTGSPPATWRSAKRRLNADETAIK